MSTSVLSQIQLQLIRIGMPICVGIGNISSILGLFVFLQRTMRNNPCILFLIGYMSTNLIYIDFTVLSTVFSGYGMDLSTISDTLCRLRMYISYVFSAIPSYLLVMASMDRMFVSSSNIRIRNRSNRRFASVMLLGILVFWILFHLHAFFFSEIQLIYGVRFSCTTRSGGPSSFISYYALLNAVIPITLMAIFGSQTLRNIRRARANHVRPRDQRLIALLVVQLSIYICLRLPASLYLVYAEITKSSLKSSTRVTIEQFVYFLVIFCQFTQVSLSPVMNLTTNSFRMELKRALDKICLRRREVTATFGQTRIGNTIQLKNAITRINQTNNGVTIQQRECDERGNE